MTEQPEKFYCILCKKWMSMSVKPVLINGELACPVHRLSDLQNVDTTQAIHPAGYGKFENGFAPIFEEIVIKEIDDKIE